MTTFLQQESMTDTLRHSSAETRKGVLDFVDRRLAELSLSITKTTELAKKYEYKSQMQAWNHWRVQLEAEQMNPEGGADARKDFYAWLLGKGKEEEHRRTAWYRNNHLTDLPDVREYIDSFVDALFEAKTQLTKLAFLTPRNIEEAWLYYKFIVHKEWMLKEDRFFWVDLINFMNEKAALGGGLLAQTIAKNRLFVEQRTQNGTDIFYPLTQDDVFDVNDPSLNIQNRVQAEFANGRIDRQRIISLRDQLNELENANDLRRRAEFKFMTPDLKGEEKAMIEKNVKLLSEVKGIPNFQTVLENNPYELEEKQQAEPETLTQLALFMTLSLVATLMGVQPELVEADTSSTKYQLITELAEIESDLNEFVRAKQTFAETLAGAEVQEHHLLDSMSKQEIDEFRQKLNNHYNLAKKIANEDGIKPELQERLETSMRNSRQLLFSLTLKGDIQKIGELPKDVVADIFQEQIPKEERENEETMQTILTAAILEFTQPPDISDIKAKAARLIDDTNSLIPLEDRERIKNQIAASLAIRSFLQSRDFLVSHFPLREGKDSAFLERVMRQKWTQFISVYRLKDAPQIVQLINDPLKMRMYADGLLQDVNNLSPSMFSAIAKDISLLPKMFGPLYAISSGPQPSELDAMFEQYQTFLTEDGRSYMSTQDFARVQRYSKLFGPLITLTENTTNGLSWFANYTKMFSSIGVSLTRVAGIWTIKQLGMTLFKVAGIGSFAAMPYGGLVAAALFTVAEKSILAALGLGPAAEFSKAALPGLFWGAMTNYLQMDGTLQQLIPEQLFSTTAKWLADMFDQVQWLTFDLRTRIYNIEKKEELLSSTGPAMNIIASIFGTIFGVPTLAGLAGATWLGLGSLSFMSWPLTVDSLLIQAGVFASMAAGGKAIGDAFQQSLSFATGLGFDATYWDLSAARFKDSFAGQYVLPLAKTIVTSFVGMANKLFYIVDSSAPIRPQPLSNQLQLMSKTLLQPTSSRSDMLDIQRAFYDKNYEESGLMGKFLLSLMINESALKVGDIGLAMARNAFVSVDPGTLIETFTKPGRSLPPMFWFAQGLRLLAPNALMIFSSVKAEAAPYLKEVADISADDLYMDWTTQRMRWQIGREMKRRHLKKRGKRAKNKEEQEEDELAQQIKGL